MVLSILEFQWEDKLEVQRFPVLAGDYIIFYGLWKHFTSRLVKSEFQHTSENSEALNSHSNQLRSHTAGFTCLYDKCVRIESYLI